MPSFYGCLKGCDRHSRIYNAAHACASLGQNWMDDLVNSLGTHLLETIWVAKLSLLLRYREYSDRRRLVVGKSSGFFLASLRIVVLSDSLYDRPGRSHIAPPKYRRRNGVYVRPWRAAHHSTIELVPCRDTADVAVGNLAPGLRSPRLEISNAHGLDRHPD
jgi:hypothetical protein